MHSGQMDTNKILGKILKSLNKSVKGALTLGMALHIIQTGKKKSDWGRRRPNPLDPPQDLSYLCGDTRPAGSGRQGLLCRET